MDPKVGAFFQLGFVLLLLTFVAGAAGGLVFVVWQLAFWLGRRC